MLNIEFNLLRATDASQQGYERKPRQKKCEPIFANAAVNKTRSD